MGCRRALRSLALGASACALIFGCGLNPRPEDPGLTSSGGQGAQGGTQNGQGGSSTGGTSGTGAFVGSGGAISTGGMTATGGTPFTGMDAAVDAGVTPGEAGLHGDGAPGPDGAAHDAWGQ